MYKKERVKGFEEYQVDTNGVVYSKSGKPLKHSLNHSNYQMINFYVNNIRTGFAIHTLVATQFIPNVLNKPTVNHKDGNKQNNHASNLEWATYKEQVAHSRDVLGNINAHARKSIKGIKVKNSNEVIYFDSLADGGRFFQPQKFQIAQNSIYRVLSGMRKTYKGYYWEYTN